MSKYTTIAQIKQISLMGKIYTVESVFFVEIGN